MWGRRSGKSYLVCHIILKTVSEGNKICWIVAPTANDADEIYTDTLQEIIRQYGWGEAGKLSNPKCNYEIKDRGLLYQFRNGSKIYLKSSDRQDRLKGRGIDIEILDEFVAFERKEKWSSIYLPLLNPNGKMVIISTPAESYDEFYRIWEMGQKGISGWKSWKETSFINDKFPGLKEDIKFKMQFMPLAQYKREYLCEFGETTNKCAHDFSEVNNIRNLPVIFKERELRIGCDFNNVLVQRKMDTRVDLVLYNYTAFL